MLTFNYSGNVIFTVPWACGKGTPSNFFWTAAGINFVVLETPRFSVITFTPQPHDHSTNLTCQVTFPRIGVTVERIIQLNVSWKCWVGTSRSLRTINGYQEGEVPSLGLLISKM
jgi:hypothetical protein